MASAICCAEGSLLLGKIYLLIQGSLLWLVALSPMRAAATDD